MKIPGTKIPGTKIAATAVAAMLMLSSCSSDDREPTAAEATSTSAAATSQVTSQSTTPPSAVGPTTSVGPVETVAEPVERLAPTPSADLGEFNIGHGLMNEQVVELWWTSVEGLEVVHRVYRVPTIGTDPNTVELNDAALVYSGPELAFIDEGADPGVFHSYILEIDADGLRSDKRAWTGVLTVTDITPPTPITDLTAESTHAGVLLSWSPSTDEIEFGAYAVLVVGSQGVPTYIGGATEEGQTRFLDNNPLPGTSTYIVQAGDFHDNRSSAEVLITLPG